MQIITLFFLVYFALINMTYAQQCEKSPPPIVNEPFQSICLNPANSPGSRLQYNYFLTRELPTLVCFAINTQLTGTITWPCSESPLTCPTEGTQTTTLNKVVLRLTGTPIFGADANSSGTITITNTTKNLIQVGCLYGF